MTSTITAALISEQDLQNRLDEILDRVEQGEIFCITRNGKPMAYLVNEPYMRAIEQLVQRNPAVAETLELLLEKRKLKKAV